MTRRVLMAAWVIGVGSLATPGDAQPPKATQPDQLPARQELELPAKDGVVVHCTYFPGPRGRQSVPVILLHGWEGKSGPGSRRDVLGLAATLQRSGHAVAAPDLRGHGDSLVRLLEGRPSQRLNRDKFGVAEIRDMTLDIEAVRSFLVGENNAGRLNLELLCVVGFEMSSVIALNWIQYDWTIPSFPAYKQGQDVKAFVLVSPEPAFKGAVARPALANQVIRGELSALLIYGDKEPGVADARRLAQTLKRSHRPIPTDPAEAKRFQDLFIIEKPTRLRGTKMLDAPTLDLAQDITNFLELRLVNRLGEFPWRDRRLP